MKLSYMNHKNWFEVTSSKSFFCTELFSRARQNLTPLLNALDLPRHSNYELGLDACIYHDLSRIHGLRGFEREVLCEVSFDFVLFSEDIITVVLVLTSELGSRTQLDDAENEIKQLKILFETCLKRPSPQFKIVGLRSSKSTLDDYTGMNFSLSQMLTWEKIATLYPSSATIFKNADNVLV